MVCTKQNGVKNILITFKDCDTDEVIGPISHELASDELPTVKACAWSNTALTGGFVTRSADNATMTINVRRDLRIPLAQYQGCAAIDIQVEKFDGTVWTMTDASVTEPDESDGHSISMTLVSDTIDELLPEGSLAA